MVLLSDSETVQVIVIVCFIYMPLEMVGKGYNPFKRSQCCACSKPEPGIQTQFVEVFFLLVDMEQHVVVRLLILVELLNYCLSFHDKAHFGF